MMWLSMGIMLLNNYRNRADLLIDWVTSAIPAGSTALDVGAGDGRFCPEVVRLAQHLGFYAGVDPDAEKLKNHAFLDARYPSSLEDANIPPESFDCLWAFFVFEHVSRETAFLQAACRALKPGGSLFFMTPNGYHPFAVIAAALQKLKLQGPVLALLKPHVMNGYHYPAVYLLNRSRKLRKLGRQCGFDRFEFRYCETLQESLSYFPGLTAMLPWLWEMFIRITRQEWCLMNVFGRLIKAQAPVRSRSRDSLL